MKPPDYHVGKSHKYWPVYTPAGVCIALCPSKEHARMFVEMLKKDALMKGQAKRG